MHTRAKRVARPSAALGLILFTALAARAQQQAPPQGAPAAPSAKLVYVRGPGTEHCPDEQSVASAVASRLGYDPFKPDAGSTVAVNVTRAGPHLRVKIQLRDGRGAVTGSRELGSAKNDCGELASAMTLAISIAIDPQSLSRPAPASPPVETPSPPPPSAAPPPPQPCPPPPPPPPPLSPPVPIIVSANAGPLVAFGAAPKAALGAIAGVDVRRRNVSIGLEGRALLDASSTSPPRGEVSSSLLLVSAVPCLHRSVFSACAMGSLGVLRGSSKGVAEPARDSSTFAMAGARAGVEVPLGRVFAWRAHGELTAILTRTTLELDGVGAWTTPTLAAALGTSIAAHFE